jgi:hypothetical protein
MADASGCRTCNLMLELEDTVSLAVVRADLEAIEVLDREIGDLTALLRARLAPEELKLAWALRDAVERVGIAEGILRERCPAAGLGRYPRECAHAE